MGAITREKISEEQFVLLLWHFDQYKKHLEAAEKDLYKFNFFERREFNKVKNKVFELWEELDAID